MKMPAFHPTFESFIPFLIAFAAVILIATIIYQLYKWRLWYYDQEDKPVKNEKESIFYEPINLN